jgi:hypothetical protein
MAERPEPTGDDPHSDARSSQRHAAGPESRDPADRMRTEPENRRDEPDDEQPGPPDEE